MTEKRQKRIALFSALTGYGRNSITVALPVLSHLKIECCPVPTAILSNHSGFPEYFYKDMSEYLPEYLSHWKTLNLTFDGICTGFLGSEAQLETVSKFITEFRSATTVVIVDPVFGDHGRVYSSCSTALCRKMKELIQLADIITPNITEACFLADFEYHAGAWSLSLLDQLAKQLRTGNPKKKIVITGISDDDFICNYVSVPDAPSQLLRVHRTGRDRNSTGDIFTAIIAADAVNGVPFEESVERAQQFIVRCMNASDEMNTDRSDGVCLEVVLDTLPLGVPSPLS